MPDVPEISPAVGSIAMSTDYDCWKENEEPVTWERILSTMSRNSENVKRLLLTTISQIRAVHEHCG